MYWIHSTLQMVEGNKQLNFMRKQFKIFTSYHYMGSIPHKKSNVCILNICSYQPQFIHCDPFSPHLMKLYQQKFLIFNQVFLYFL